jgi:tRNA-2-methylthio-N6-dimethylallyladenosine synthase
MKTLSAESKTLDVGTVVEVLAEGTSKKSKSQLFGRTSQNKIVVFPRENYLPGQYVNVLIEDCSSSTLKGKVVK